jgi:hypothetical protein
MVLIPLFIFFIAEGFVTFTYFFSTVNRTLFALLFTGAWIVIFLASSHFQITQRTDLYDDKNVSSKAEEYEIDLLIRDFSNGPIFIPGMVESYSVEKHNIRPLNFDSKTTKFNTKPPQVIGLIARAQLTNDQIQSIYDGATGKFGIPPAKKLELLYKDERQSNIEVEWSARTHSGGNGFFFYIFYPYK